MVVKALIALIVVAVVGLFGWWLLAPMPSAEDAIRARLDTLITEVHKPLSVRGLQKMAQISSLRQFFTEDVRIDTHDDRVRIEGRDQLMGSLQGIYSYINTIKITLTDEVIIVSDDGKHADVTLTVLATGREQEHWPYAQEVMLQLVLQDGEWLIRYARPVEILELD